MPTPWRLTRVSRALGLALLVAGSAHVVAGAQGTVGPNINVVTGSADQLTGDEFRQRQNESVIGISSINPSHMMVAYNDYRTVDFLDPLAPPDVPPAPLQHAVARLLDLFFAPWRRDGPPPLRGKGQGTLIAAAQAWIGLSFSDNGGKDWYTGLHPGHAALPGFTEGINCRSRLSPSLNDGMSVCPEGWDRSYELAQYAAASDPVMATTHNEFFVSGIAFNPGPSGSSTGFVSRFADRNDTERGQNIQFDGTSILLQQPSRYFVDKPSIAAAPGALGGKSYVYAAFVVFDNEDRQGLSSKIQLYRSQNSGEEWVGPVVISEPFSRNQAPAIVVDPNDPRTVHVFWRVFAARTGGPQNAIVRKTSTDGGTTFRPGAPLPVARPLKAFDQPQVSLDIAAVPPILSIARSTAYPTAVIDGNGAIHVALQEYVDPTTGMPLPGGASPALGVPRITVTSSYNGGVAWTARRAVDFGPGTGTQFMPTLAALGEPGPPCAGSSGPRSRVMLMYYDTRASQTGMAPGSMGYVQGADRQFDVRLAEASACNREGRGGLRFGASQQMSRYTISAEPPHEIVKAAGWGYTAVNRAYSMFCGGKCPFVGDYMALTARVPYVLTPDGWKLTTAAAVDPNVLPAPVVTGVWADSRDVALPTYPDPILPQGLPGFIDGLGWNAYQPPGTGKTSKDQCLNPGSRDQNIYAAEYAPGGLFAAAPETFRPSNIPRAYPLYVENRRAVLMLVKLTINPGANASFDYRSFDVNAAEFGSLDTEADIAIGPYSTVTGSVVIGPGQSEPVLVTIAEVDRLGSVIPDGARTSVTLFTTGAADETTAETHAPAVAPTPIVTKPFPDGTFPVTVSAATPFTQNPFSQNPFSQNPFSQNPFNQNPFSQNPFSQNPFTQNPFAQNAASGTIYDVTDTSFIVTMADGSSHTAAFTALLNIQNALQLEGSYLFQVFVSRTSSVPGLEDCTSFDGAHNVQISSIITPFSQNPFSQNSFSQNPFSQNPFSQNPFSQNPFTQNPFTQNPFSQNTHPSDPALSTSTFYLAPLAGAGGGPLAAAAASGPSYRANRNPDIVIYTLRAFQIRAATDPAFVDLFSPSGDPQVGITVTGETPNVIETPDGGFVFDPAGPSTSRGGAGPVQLAFVVQPTATTPGQAIVPAIQVAIQDGFGNTMTDSTLPVTLMLGANPSGGTLSGTTTKNAVNGIATFTNLAINTVGSGYTLIASSPGLTGATSDPFAVTTFTAWGIAAICDPGDMPEVVVAGDTITLGMPRGDVLQPSCIHGASKLLPPLTGGNTKYRMTFTHNLFTWDSYNQAGTPGFFGTGYWDSFSVSVSNTPYKNLGLMDRITTANLPGLGFIWGGTDYGDNTLECNPTAAGSCAGTIAPAQVTVDIPGNLTGNNYLNVVLDTWSEPEGNHQHPSWGTITILDVVPVSAGSFAATGSMTGARAFHTVTVLNNGKVLIAGGVGPSGGLASAELYDPATATFSQTGNMLAPREQHTATLLSNGKVLIAGGFGVGGGALLSAELYDPSTGIFSAAGNLNAARGAHTATLVPSGYVLIAGGFSSCTQVTCTGRLESIEIYNPDTGGTPGPNMAHSRGNHSATLLSDGKVLVAGGLTLPVAQLYDPVTNTFSATINMIANRRFHTATLLATGKVLITGGNSTISGSFVEVETAELYDPATNAFTATPNMGSKRGRVHAATLLPDGKVLVTGGYNGTADVSSAELYDPAANVFSSAASMSVSRRAHGAVLLPTGKVLIVGGLSGAGYLATAELYDPGTTAPSTFVISYGEIGADESQSMVALADGSVVIAGDTTSFGASGKDVWVKKVGPTGNILWQKRYGGTGNDGSASYAGGALSVVNIIATSDGGFAVAATTTSFGAGLEDAWILKLDANGNLVWHRTYGTASVDAASGIVQLPSGNYVVAGSALAAGIDAWIFEIDGSGNIVWQTRVGGGADDYAASIALAPGGGIAVTGWTYSFGSAGDLWVMKMSGPTTVNWFRVYGGNFFDGGRSIVATSDGHLALAGSGLAQSSTQSAPAWVLKIDNANGNSLWQKTYDLGSFDPAWSIVQASDGGFAVAGPWGGDASILKLDSTGNIVWQKRYGGVGVDQGRAIVQTADGGYAVAGITFSFSASMDSLLIRVPSTGVVPSCSLAGDTTAAVASSTISPSAPAPTVATTMAATGAPATASSVDTAALVTQQCPAP